MPQARDQVATDEIRKLRDELGQLGWYHSIALPDGSVIPGLLSIERLQTRLAQFPIPDDLTGKRVLDIGAWDGWFSFEMERRGARVVAVDSTSQTKFLVAKELLNSKVEYHVEDVCRLSPRDIGYFDIVLFFGVLYHVKHPLLALENVCELATELACVESFVTADPPSSSIPMMEFYEGVELCGQFDNWVGPNTACLLAFCRTAGFARVELKSVFGHRAHVACHRKWPQVASAGPAPDLISIENSASHDLNFSVKRDDYIGIWFESPVADLTCENVWVQVGPYGTRPAGVYPTGGLKHQANCKLPPGLSPGWQNVSVRAANSPWSASARIPVDLPRGDRAGRETVSDDLKIELVTDGKTWDRYRVRTGNESCVSTWVTGLPDGTMKPDVALRLHGADLPAVYVDAADDAQGRKQVNAMLPSGLEPGDYSLALRFRDAESRPVWIEVFRP